MRKSLLLLFFTMFSFVTIQSVMAQPIDPPCDNEDPSFCPDVPFDGEAAFLLLGGISLLGWKAFKRKK